MHNAADTKPPSLPLSPRLLSPRCLKELFIAGPDRRLHKLGAKQQQQKQQQTKMKNIELGRCSENKSERERILRGKTKALPPNSKNSAVSVYGQIR